MEQGTQIAYIPLHAGGDIDHLDVEFGFVTEERGDNHFCRYWRKGVLGALRTVANSDATPTDMMIRHVSVDQAVVDHHLRELNYAPI